MSARRVVAALLAMMLGAAVLTVLSSAPPASADKAPPGSAKTLSGTGDFMNLKVTVSQTNNLINQTVAVTWKGGVPTVPGTEFGLDYLQIMQCWGDDPGPDRTQCQYGGSVTQTAPSAGSWVRSRQVSYGQLVDPKETLKKQANGFDQAYVPFWPVGKPQPTDVATSDHSDFYDAQVTNENPTARTHGDGTGVEFFEIQTVTQAAGLGCGEPVNTGGTVNGRKCWLVVVPRGNKEVDGSTVADNRLLNSSPLSETNWENRIVFPLEFLPVGLNCPIGAAERRMIGHELAAEAVSRWQPVLCAGGGALYNYTQLGDEVIRSQVLDGSSPGLALMTNPIPPDQAPPDRPLVYAPVGLSGLAIAFNVEHQAAPGAPPEQVQLDGQRFPSMKLTPQLVAKLLTQSYQGAVAGQPDYLKTNPTGLTVDPEFLKINSDYTAFANFNIPPDALVQLTNSDLTSLLWSWVKADPDARDFLAGKPDPSGMVVNPNNKDLALPTSTFPRNDQGCLEVVVGTGLTGKICTLDSHPFTNDMHDSGLSASRGDTQARTVVDGGGGTAVVKKVDRQPPGRRAVLALVDAATASRYGLPTAQLQNAAKAFVAPTTESLQAGEAAMKPSGVGGVLAPDLATTNPAAYPLTALSYAVTAPAALDAAAGKDYAAFLRYAAGPGQLPGVEPGQLPFGMAPLPDVLKAQAIAAAATIETQAGKVPGSPAALQPTSAGGAAGPPAGLASGANEAASTGGTATSSGSSGTPPPGAVAQVPGGLGGKAPSVAEQPVAGVRRTPSLPVPAVGALLLVILISGGLAVTSSPVLHLLSGGGLRRWRKEVVPPEQ
jgi:hypothetical protein